VEQDASIRSTNRFLRTIALIEDGILVTLLTVMILVAGVQILLRNFLDIGLAWGDEALRILVLWVSLMGAVAASRENKHINIDVLLRFLSKPARAVSQVIVGLFTAFVCGVIAIYAGRFVYLDYEAGAKALGNFPVWIVELILPVGFAIISLRYVLFSFTQVKEFRVGEGKS
jgi:TRAP-type C4-dicarboxylate transport system permease small subunit